MSLRPTISARYLDLLVAHAASRGLSIPDLRIPACPEPKPSGVDVSCIHLASLLDALAATSKDEAYAIDYVASLPPRPDGVYQTIIFHSRTFRDALCAMCRFAALVSDAFDLRYEEDAHIGAVVFDFPHDLIAHHQFVLGQVAIIAVRAKQMLGEQYLPVRVDLTIPPPADLRRFTELFGGNIHFGSRLNRIAFGRSCLHRALQGADFRLAEQLGKYGLQLLEEKSATRPLQDRVETYLRGALQRGEATEKALCRELGIGRRTLQRELMASGTSFRRLLEQQRMRLAEQYLVAGNVSLTAISALLGYSELSAFSRACKGWFGMSPSAMRRGKTDTIAAEPIPR